MRFYSWALLSLIGSALSSPVPDLGNRALAKKETGLNAFLAILLDNLPFVDGTISAVIGVLNVFEDLIVDLTGEQITYNELGGPCTEYTVIFARGTSEPGNVGILVGPPFFSALESLVATSALTIQGVNNYAASIEGYLEGGDPQGSADMASQIKAAYAACPKTKLVAAGYSQGAQVVHNAIGLLPAATASWINKVILFGDPDDGKSLPNVASSKVDTYCHVGDDICLDGPLVLVPHLTYAENAAAAASFVVS